MVLVEGKERVVPVEVKKRMEGGSGAGKERVEGGSSEREGEVGGWSW